MGKIVFQNEESGYNKTQVDSYIEKLSEAYQVAYDENQTIQRKYSAMLDDYAKLEQESKTNLNPAILAKTIMDMEMLAQTIVNEAKAEAESLKGEALKVLDEANENAAVIEAQSQKLADDAIQGKAYAEHTARRIIDEARLEAAELIETTKNNIEEAQEIINITLTNAQNLLTGGEEIYSGDENANVA